MPGGKRKIKPVDGVISEAYSNSPSKDDVLLSWESLSFERKAKDFKWYIAAAVFVIAVIAFSAWQRDWFFIVIIIIVSAVAFWYLRSIKPQKLAYTITPLGVTIGNKVFPYSEIHSYWIIYKPTVKTLYIALNKRYLPVLTINLGDMDPVAIRTVLSRKIPEQAKRDENLIDKLIRIVGF